MTRILVICEGQTEMEFVRTVLAPHVAAKGRYLIPTLISARNGKVEHGALIAQAIGIATIRQKCPRFDKWVAHLEAW